MRASKRSRNRPDEPPSTSVARPTLTDGLKCEIALIVRAFEFTGKEYGTCMARALIGRALLQELGVQVLAACGGMLYRAGPHPVRDTLRFCLQNNMDGYLYDGSRAFLYGHVWLETDADIVDFSCGDWMVSR